MIWPELLATNFLQLDRSREAVGKWGKTDFSLVESGPRLGRIDLEAFKGVWIHSCSDGERGQWYGRGKRGGQYQDISSESASNFLYLPAGRIKERMEGR